MSRRPLFRSAAPVWMIAALAAACQPADDKDDTDDTVDSETDDPDNTDETDETEVETDETDETEVETDETDETEVETDETDTDTDTDTAVVDTFDTSGVTAPADLILTEVVDRGTSPALRYVEICNRGDAPVSLDGWGIKVFRNGSTRGVRTRLNNAAVLQPGAAYVVGYGGATGLPARPDYVAAFGDGPTAYSPDVNGDGNDAYVLEYRHLRVDTFGVPGSTTTTGWLYDERVAVRGDAVTEPVDVYAAAEWTISTNFATNASLGRCTEVVDTDTDTDTDTFQYAETADTYETDLRDTSVVVDPPRPLSELVVGDLVITEIMADPAACADGRGFYLGITSFVTETIDVDGLQLTNAAGTTVELDVPYAIRPGEEIVVWVDPGPSGHCYFPRNFGIPVTGISFDAAGDRVRIVNPLASNLVLDEVDFRAWTPGTEGYAWQLDADIVDPAQNDDQAAWCPATFPISGSTDFGNPGAANEQCPEPETDETDDTVETDTLVIDTDPVFVPIEDLAVGDLVITEFMLQPTISSVCASVADGQYLEVYNTTSSYVDLTGLRIIGGSGFATVEAGASAEPGEAVILYREPNGALCHPNFATTRAFTTFSYNAGVVWDVTGDSVQIRDASDRVLDTVDFSAWPTKAVVGTAWGIDRDFASVTGNDNWAHWCLDGYTISSNNNGTPGRVLDCLVLPIDTDTDL